MKLVNAKGNLPIKFRAVNLITHTVEEIKSIDFENQEITLSNDMVIHQSLMQPKQADDDFALIQASAYEDVNHEPLYEFDVVQSLDMPNKDFNRYLRKDPHSGGWYLCSVLGAEFMVPQLITEVTGNYKKIGNTLTNPELLG